VVRDGKGLCSFPDAVDGTPVPHLRPAFPVTAAPLHVYLGRGPDPAVRRRDADAGRGCPIGAEPYGGQADAPIGPSPRAQPSLPRPVRDSSVCALSLKAIPQTADTL
jgi:hypothetical protein